MLISSQAYRVIYRKVQRLGRPKTEKYVIMCILHRRTAMKLGRIYKITNTINNKVYIAKNIYVQYHGDKCKFQDT